MKRTAACSLLHVRTRASSWRSHETIGDDAAQRNPSVGNQDAGVITPAYGLVTAILSPARAARFFLRRNLKQRCPIEIQTTLICLIFKHGAPTIAGG